MYATGAEGAYEILDVMHVDLKDIEKEASNMRELADVFEFPDLVGRMEEVVSMCRRDVVLIKKLWDLSAMVTSTIDRWNGTLWAGDPISLAQRLGGRRGLRIGWCCLQRSTLG